MTGIAVQALCIEGTGIGNSKKVTLLRRDQKTGIEGAEVMR